MPYPAQVTHESIVETAWELVEAEGLDQLSLGRLAAALGIKAPSLYKHIASKAALLKAVNELTEARLFEALAPVLEQMDDPRQRLLNLARAYRAFALDHPVTYVLAYTTSDPDSRPDPARQEAAALPLQAVVAEITGEADSLAALRGLWALIHGFVLLEIHTQFRRGGELSAAYEQALAAYLDGWG